MNRILVTGANGFVGRALCTSLLALGKYVRGTTRHESDKLPQGVESYVIGDLAKHPDWISALKKVEVVIHCAAQVPASGMFTTTSVNLRQVNREGTRQLAEACVENGVRRFVFLSTLKVLGEHNHSGKPFNLDSLPNPADDYAKSKLEAENELWQIAKRSGLEVVVVRPPLVYGPRVRGKFLQLWLTVSRRLPLPLGRIENLNSLVGLGNLVDLLCVCSTHFAAAGKTFLVSDGEDVSTPELIRRIAKAQGRSGNLLSIPLLWLRLFGKISGRKRTVQRLLSSFQVDISNTCCTLDWSPPFSMEEELSSIAMLAKASGNLSALRGLDFLLAFCGLIVSAPLLFLLVVIGYCDTRLPLFRQVRVGRNQQPFVLVKFRTMRPETASVATHLADPDSITYFGNFLRRTKLDELPQLWNVLKGEMSLVGPRPCLFNQKELIQERIKRGVFIARPGITGLAQVEGIDMSTPDLLAETEARLLASLGIGNYFRYIFLTILGKRSSEKIKS